MSPNHLENGNSLGLGGLELSRAFSILKRLHNQSVFLNLDHPAYSMCSLSLLSSYILPTLKGYYHLDRQVCSIC